MSRNSKRNNTTLVQEILLSIYNAGDVFFTTFTNPYGWEKFSPQKRRSIFSTVSRLKSEGYLKEVEQKGRKQYIATLKGKAKILAFIKKDKSWDGKWRIVIFDVPETKKKMRNYFRARLFDLGFRKLQESVWICPYNISNIVEELIDFCQAHEYIHYLLVEELDNKDVLMKLFKLSEKKS